MYRYLKVYRAAIREVLKGVVVRNWNNLGNSKTEVVASVFNSMKEAGC